MRRRVRRRSTFASADAFSPMLRLLLLLAALGFIYSWAKRPTSWSWLATPGEESSASVLGNEPGASVPSQPARAETISGAATDRDAQEAAAAHKQFEAISDKTPLDKVEMPAYWRLM